MKIAINTRFLLKGQLEGIGWVTYELAKRLVEQHPEDEFLFLFDRPYEKEFVFGPNVTPLVLFPPARHPFLWYAWFEFSVPRALKKFGADVFFSPDGYCSLSTKVPSAMLLHDLAYIHIPEQIPYSGRKYYEYFMPKYIRRADHIMVVSDFVKNDVLQHVDIPSSKIETIYNACRADFKPIPTVEKQQTKEKFASGKPFFFYVGAVHPRKNVHRLIEAFDQFKEKNKSDVQLLIGGRFAWKTGPVTAAYEKAKYQSDIHFLGYIKKEELPKILAAALALVYVSLFEGFGLPLIEAMNTETPFISSKVCSMPEVAGDAGLLVDPYSVKEISEAMTKIATNQKNRQSIIEKGNLRKKQFDWDQSAKRVYEILAGLKP